MTILTEGIHTGEYIVSEANAGSTGVSRSRSMAILAAGEDLKAGAVLGQITATGLFVEYNPANADGSEVAAAILFAATDASLADTEVVIHARDCEVSGNTIQWLSGFSQGQIDTGVSELDAVSIFVK